MARAVDGVGPGAEDGARRLGRAVAAMALCSATLFCLLVGLGTWLVGSPAPDWVPARPLWIGGLLAAGLALCPVWYRLGYGTPGGAAPAGPAEE